MLIGVPCNDVYRCVDEVVTAPLPPIEIPVVMTFDEADFMFHSFMVQATYQSVVIVSDLVTAIAASHHIFHHLVNAHGCALQRCLLLHGRADGSVSVGD